MSPQRALRFPDAWPALVAALVAGLVAFVVLQLRPATSTCLIIAIGVVAVGPMLFRIAQGRFDPFEPVFVFALAWAGMFVVRPIAMLANNEFSYIWAKGIEMRPYFDKMLLLALLAGIGWVVGYALPAGKRLALKAPAPPEGARVSTVIVIACALAFFSIGLFGIFVAQGGSHALEIIFGGRSEAQNALLGRANKYLILGPVMLVGATVILFAIGLNRGRPGVVGLSFGFLALTWLVWNTTGSRVVLFPMFAAMLIIFYMHHDRRPGALTLLALLSIAVFASAVIGFHRTAKNREEQSYPGAALEVALHPDKIAYPLVKGADDSMAPGMVAAISVVPREKPYDYGWGVLRDGLVRPIPRSQWPSKPLAPRQDLIKTMNPQDFQNKNANPEMSSLLIPYLSWGMFGALWLVAYGIAARAVWEWFKLHKRNVAAQMIYALTLPLFLSVLRDSPVDAGALAIFIIVPIWLTFWLGRLRLRG
jgi:hypothetical protein